MGEETTLRKLRKASGMSIRQMASRLGVKEDRLRKWETGATAVCWQPAGKECVAAESKRERMPPRP